MDVQNTQVQESIDDIADLISGMKIQTEVEKCEVEEIEDRDTTPTPQVDLGDLQQNESNPEPILRLASAEKTREIPQIENSVKTIEPEKSENLVEITAQKETNSEEIDEKSQEIPEIENSAKTQEVEKSVKMVPQNEAHVPEKSEIEKSEPENSVKSQEIETIQKMEIPDEPAEKLINLSIEQNPDFGDCQPELKSLEKLGKILTPVQKLKNAEKIQSGTPSDIEKIKLENPKTPVKNDEELNRDSEVVETIKKHLFESPIITKVKDTEDDAKAADFNVNSEVSNSGKTQEIEEFLLLENSVKSEEIENTGKSGKPEKVEEPEPKEKTREIEEFLSLESSVKSEPEKIEESEKPEKAQEIEKSVKAENPEKIEELENFVKSTPQMESNLTENPQNSENSGKIEEPEKSENSGKPTARFSYPFLDGCQWPTESPQENVVCCLDNH